MQKVGPVKHYSNKQSRFKNINRASFAAAHRLVGEQQRGLERKLARAEVEEILEGRAEQLHHHHIVLTLRAAPPDHWDAHCNMG